MNCFSCIFWNVIPEPHFGNHGEKIQDDQIYLLTLNTAKRYTLPEHSDNERFRIDTSMKSEEVRSKILWTILTKRNKIWAVRQFWLPHNTTKYFDQICDIHTSLNPKIFVANIYSYKFLSDLKKGNNRNFLLERLQQMLAKQP